MDIMINITSDDFRCLINSILNIVKIINNLSKLCTKCRSDSEEEKDCKGEGE
jgi:hypothetical protein